MTVQLSTMSVPGAGHTGLPKGLVLPALQDYSAGS